MAAVLPTDIFAGYELVAAAGTVTAESICIPLSALTELTSGEANATTGDGGQLIRALDVAIHEAIAALPEIEQPDQVTLTVTTEYTSPLTRVRTFRRAYNEEADNNAFDLVAE